MGERRIILFTGLGANARLLEPQRRALADLHIVEWVAHRPSDTLRDYAARMADTAGVRDGDIVGGASMGGMVALEVAALAKVRGVLLIGSCRSPAALSVSAHNAARLGRVTPDMLLENLRRFAPWAIRQLGARREEDRTTLLAMASACNMPFLKWAGDAIVRWPGQEDPGVPVRHLHGTRDRIISPRHIHADTLIPGAGHVPSLSHASDVCAFIERARREWAHEALSKGEQA